MKFDVLRLAGRCANGFEADGGTRWHAVPAAEDDRPAGYKALCGRAPGKRSAGWSSKAGKVVTCPRCLDAIDRVVAAEVKAATTKLADLGTSGLLDYVMRAPGGRMRALAKENAIRAIRKRANDAAAKRFASLVRHHEEMETLALDLQARAHREQDRERLNEFRNSPTEPTDWTQPTFSPSRGDTNAD